MPSVQASFLPHLVAPDAIAGATVVVLDVLRATTTITTALAAGARQVIPCLEVDDALRTAAGLPAGTALLGGERGGLLIPGFDLGNSPRDYTPERVAGRTLVFTTTNGTRAMQRCLQADRVLAGALVNVGAIVRELRTAQRVYLLCAGTEDEITREDVLAAGAIVHRLTAPDDSAGANPWGAYDLDDCAEIALDAWRALMPPGASCATEVDQQRLVRALEASHGGQNLIGVGLGHDIADGAALDRYDLVGELDVDAWTIQAR